VRRLAHVRHAAYLSFSPQQLVIVEGRHLSDECIDCHTPPLRRLESASTTTLPLGAKYAQSAPLAVCIFVTNQVRRV